jgi:hypothetical protein
MDVSPPVTSRAPRRRSAPAAWWASRSPLARDVTVILIVKAIILGLLWFAFFRSPLAPRMAMEPQRVEQRLLAPAPSAEDRHAVP